MATIVVPVTRWATPVTADFGLRQSVILSTSPLDGHTQTVEMLGARWVCTLNYNNQTEADRARLEGMFGALRAQANRLSMGHPLRRKPRGAMRGSPTLSGSHADGLTTLNISGDGNSLMAGDMLGIGSGAAAQLVMVTEDNPLYTSVPITPPLRTTHSGGTAITWDWPRTLWIATSDAVRLPVGRVTAGPFSVELVEVFS